MGKTLVKTERKTTTRDPKAADTPKSTTPNTFQALCIVAKHFQGKPAAWMAMRSLLDRVSHNCAPERFYQEFKYLLEQGK